MRKLSATLVALACVATMVGCTTNKTIGGPTFATKAKLQLAIGTLNDSAGTLTSTPGTYANAVATFRNQLGTSPYINPGTSTLAVPGGATATTCGLYSYGQNPAAMLAPFSNVNGITGPIGTYAPAFGAPPAMSPGNSNGIGYALGYLLYFNAGDPNNAPCSLYVLPPAALAGTYTLNTTVSANGQNLAYSASATLGNFVLPADSAPAYTPGAAGSGGGTFTISKPVGVTESLIVVVGGPNSPAVATVESANTTGVVPAGTLAPGTYFAYVIGADFPLVESSPANNTSQTPTIVGSGGTADITVSGVSQITQP